MIAKLNSYDPESGRCTINLGGRIYEFSGAGEIIREYHAHVNQPIPVGQREASSAYYEFWKELETLVEKHRFIAVA